MNDNRELIHEDDVNRIAGKMLGIIKEEGETSFAAAVIAMLNIILQNTDPTSQLYLDLTAIYRKHFAKDDMNN